MGGRLSTMTWKLVVIVVALLAVAACSGDDDASGGDATPTTSSADGGDPGTGDTATESDAVRTTLASLIAADAAPGDVFSDPAEAECAARAAVESIGADRLTALGVGSGDVSDMTDLSLEPDEVELMADAVMGCADFRAQVLRFLEEDLPADDAACVGEALDDQFIRNFVVAGITFDDALMDGVSSSVEDAMGSCGLS